MLLGCLLAVSVLIAAGLCLVTGSFAGVAWLWLLPVSFGLDFFFCRLYIQF